LEQRIRDIELTFITPPLDIDVPVEISDPATFFMLCTKREIAKQLTIIDQHAFGAIQPTELLDGFWCADYKQFLAPNVTKILQWQSNLSSFYICCILWHESHKDRVACIAHLVAIAKVHSATHYCCCAMTLTD
jgi:hypothetical protein